MRSILKNKKGAEMALSTIVVIILALVVLIFVIFGFTSGWNNIWQKILNFGGGSSNVATIVQACQAACATNDAYSFCGNSRSLIMGDGVKYSGSCYTLSKDVAQANIAACSVDCASYTKSLTTCPAELNWKDSCDAKTETDKTPGIQDSQGKDVSKKKCCVANP